MRALRVVLVEDNPDDAELILLELNRAGYVCEATRVQTADAFGAALGPSVDLVLADYRLPTFDALRALQLLRACELDIPFIIVSGAIREDLAMAAIRNGASDYVLKDRLGRLGRAVDQAIEGRTLRAEQRRTAEALRHRLRELAILQEIAARFAASLSAPDIMLTAVRTASELTSSDGGILPAAFFEVGNGRWRALVSFGEAGPRTGSAYFALEEHPALAAVVETEQIMFSTYRDATGGRRGDWAAPAEFGGVYIPVIVDGRLVGVLGVATAQRELGSIDLGPLTSLTTLTALALTSAARYQREQEMVRRLSQLVHINTGLARHSEPEAMLRELVDVSRVMAQADSAAIVLTGTGGRRVETFVVADDTEDGQQLVSDELLDRVLQAHAPLRLRDATEHGTPGSFLGAALRSREGVLGALYVRGRRGAASFDERDTAILEGIAAQAAVALENARLVQTLSTHAITDPLTGLANRRHFERALSHRPREDFAILAIDVDNLKKINDDHGHEAGDELLRAVGASLGAAVRSWDLVARVGGDEFAALLHRVTPEEADLVAERMRGCLHGTTLRYGQARVSIGCATGKGGADATVLWRSADAALYQAKRAGRDRLVHAGGLTPDRMATAASAETVSRCLTDDGVSAVYQPLIELRSGALAGFEALARPLGFAASDSVEELFSAAQRLGLASDLDWRSRRAAIADAHRLPQGVPLFINVGARCLLDPVHDVDQMLLLLQWARRSPEEVVLEITERETVLDLERLRIVLAAYREHGFRFAVDDVGEGHSTLELLAAAQPEFIKLAHSLTMSASQPGPRSAIAAVVAFAGAAGAQVVAEGLEDQEALERVLELGVELGQGRFLGAPAPAASFTETGVAATSEAG